MPYLALFGLGFVAVPVAELATELILRLEHGPPPYGLLEYLGETLLWLGVILVTAGVLGGLLAGRAGWIGWLPMLGGIGACMLVFDLASPLGGDTSYVTSGFALAALPALAGYFGIRGAIWVLSLVWPASGDDRGRTAEGRYWDGISWADPFR